MRNVAAVRRELGMATTFNLIGPLTNPAGARHQLIGVADERYVDRLAQAVRMMGSQRNLVVHSDDGLDEISTTCPTAVVEVFAGEGYDRRYTVTPEQFGLRRARLSDLVGGDAATNARMLREVVDGVPGTAARHRPAECGRGPLHRRGGGEHRRGRREGARGGRLRRRARPPRRPRERHQSPQGRDVMSGDFLEGMVAAARERVAQARRERPRAAPPLRPGAGRLRDALATPAAGGLGLVAEVKRASPSKGVIATGLVAADKARAYEEAGADAVSVLTEPTRFGGSLEDLADVAAAVSLPVLRKDFIVDAYQVWEAAELGAAAVLLIVAALPGDRAAGARKGGGALWTGRARRGSRRERGRPRARRRRDADRRQQPRPAHPRGRPGRDRTSGGPTGATTRATACSSSARVASPRRPMRGEPRRPAPRALLVGEALVRAPRDELAGLVAEMKGVAP